VRSAAGSRELVAAVELEGRRAAGARHRQRGATRVRKHYRPIAEIEGAAAGEGGGPGKIGGRSTSFGRRSRWR
jgi:hypothetical protein